MIYNISTIIYMYMKIKYLDIFRIKNKTKESTLIRE